MNVVFGRSATLFELELDDCTVGVGESGVEVGAGDIHSGSWTFKHNAGGISLDRVFTSCVASSCRCWHCRRMA